MRSAASSASAPPSLILINGLFLQSGPHPAPMVKSSLSANRDRSRPSPIPPPALPRSRPVGDASRRSAEPAAPQRPAVETITDIQRELIAPRLLRWHDRRPLRTEDRRRDPRFRACGWAEAQHRAERGAAARHQGLNRQAAKTTGSTGRTRRRSFATIRSADILGPVEAGHSRVQRALAEFGYAQIKPTGILDPETQAAIERFERERKLPITGRCRIA